MEENLLNELLDWAKALKAQYNSINPNSIDAMVFVESANDFIDTFIERAEDI